MSLASCVRDFVTRSLICFPVYMMNDRFAFCRLLNIIQMLCVNSSTSCLIRVDWPRRSSIVAKECILGYTFEPDVCLAQASSTFRHCSARTFSFRTFLHELESPYWSGRLQRRRKGLAVDPIHSVCGDWRHLYTAHLSRRIRPGDYG